mmetsp:Transcript_21014/g.35056  ORF Transcript_21014/g.35056 Transcript_21014/m.35056 type:complete len:375 (+) Transcript_21014:106-1230(+)|eukprot:CAMPEP_0184358510 /NCGR_PEP_ID=MMETSP1089-20130417/115183_1 /TAXON_ID=38269 ORGANISM="Gloeochaete wittrockiana, Strain SAG46.84" /NCGR_SAMPLE_ID=MMETSP1089 /ASSEMBLY_ACC=CAM_ASM_000445 /LENGTH=374 /DNA_ID=CAMNT_0026696887 /DNA_START=63 /DNA_END=1187 /DNA_ORIENTATION=+
MESRSQYRNRRRASFPPNSTYVRKPIDTDVRGVLESFLAAEEETYASFLSTLPYVAQLSETDPLFQTRSVKPIGRPKLNELISEIKTSLSIQNKAEASADSEHSDDDEEDGHLVTKEAPSGLQLVTTEMDEIHGGSGEMKVGMFNMWPQNGDSGDVDALHSRSFVQVDNFIDGDDDDAGDVSDEDPSNYSFIDTPSHLTGPASPPTTTSLLEHSLLNGLDPLKKKTPSSDSVMYDSEKRTSYVPTPLTITELPDSSSNTDPDPRTRLPFLPEPSSEACESTPIGHEQPRPSPLERGSAVLPGLTNTYDESDKVVVAENGNGDEDEEIVSWKRQIKTLNIPPKSDNPDDVVLFAIDPAFDYDHCPLTQKERRPMP